MDKIEKRKPILDVLEAEGVKAAFNESQKRKREEEEDSRKRQKIDKVTKYRHYPENIIIFMCFKRMTICTKYNLGGGF